MTFSCPSSPSLDEHPNPVPIFPCSVYAGNVTWRGKSVQCCTCSKWVHLLQMGASKVLTTFPLQIQSSWQLLALTLGARPPLLTLLSRPTLVSKLLILHLPILYLPPLPPHHRPLLLAALQRLLSPLTLSGLFNGMLKVLEPGALNYFTFFRPILSTLSAFRNPILASLPFSGFLDSLLCILIAPTPGLAFSLLMPRTLAAVSSFSSGRAYLFPNFLPPLFLCLIPTLIIRDQHLS